MLETNVPELRTNRLTGRARSAFGWRDVYAKSTCGWRAADASTRLYWLSVGLVFLLGVLFRSVRYFHDLIALWGDEAVWASRLIEQPVLAPSFRPLGFMLVSRALAELFGADERALRLPAYLASLASLWLFFALAVAWLRERWTRVLLLGVAAFHPMLIDFAREFKPYSVELAVHLFLLVRYVRHEQTGARRDLYWVLGSALGSVVFAYNTIFAFPALFGVLGTAALRGKRWHELRAILITAATILAVLGALALVVFTAIPKGEDDSQFWGKKYGVFYIPNPTQSHAAWIFSKALEMTQLPGVGRLFWELPSWLSGTAGTSFSSVERFSWTLLAVVGVVALVRARRVDRLLLLGAPLLTMLAFNLAGRWPWGAFRVNLFALAYTLPIALVGLDWVSTYLGRYKWPALAGAALIQCGPSLAFGFGLHETKRAWTGHAEFPKLAAHMRDVREERLSTAPSPPRELILLDAYTCGVQRFYFGQHRAFIAREKDFFAKHFTWCCVPDPKEMAKIIQARKGQRTWAIVAKWPLVPGAQQTFERSVRIGELEVQQYSHLLLRSDG